MNGRPVFDPSLVFLPGAAERRAAVMLAAEQRSQERRRKFEELASPSRTPGEKIAIWERLFAVPLPDGPEHPLIRVILAHTGLTADQIRQEQQRRREGARR
jgi:hypothetical protein